MDTRKFLSTISSVALLLSTSACFNSEAQTSSNDFQRYKVQTKSKQYAGEIEQYALQSVDALTSSADWQNGAISTLTAGVLIGNGGAHSSGEDYLESGYCLSNPADPTQVTHITWFESHSDDGFTLFGLGENSSAQVLTQLSMKNHVGALGIYKDNNSVDIVNADDPIVIPAQCQAFDIPYGAPVLISNIDLPSPPEDSVTKTEYTTVACGAGEVGHLLLSLDVTTLPNGDRVAKGKTYKADESLPPVSSDPASTEWDIVEANCQAQIVLNTIETTQLKVDAVSLTMSASNTVGINLNDSLQDIDCREAKTRRNEETPDDPPPYGRDPEELESYDTCSETTEIETIDNVSDIRVRRDRIETHSSACGGMPGSFIERVDGYDGNVTHDVWLGNAVYQREVFQHDATGIIDAAVSREMREQWQGVSIECSRVENLLIGCADVHPSVASFTTNNGYNYSRNNNISGWADSVNLVPNAATDPAWTFQAGTSGCGWTEEESWNCSAGTLVQSGHRSRAAYSSSITTPVSLAAWSLTQPSICTQLRRRTEPVYCDVVGVYRNSYIWEERTHTSTAPGVGVDGPWVELTRTTADCPCGGGCLVGDTLVLMHDGSTKPIEQIQVGDVTAAGRVLEKYLRPYDNRTAHTSENLFMMNGGLFEFDGVQVTGRHPVYKDGKWIETGDNLDATQIEGRKDMAVYNLLTENNIIPVVGASGKVYLYSDELNNIHNVAEKGRIKTEDLIMHLISSSAAAA